MYSPVCLEILRFGAADYRIEGASRVLEKAVSNLRRAIEAAPETCATGVLVEVASGTTATLFACVAPKEGVLSETGTACIGGDINLVLGATAHKSSQQREKES